MKESFDLYISYLVDYAQSKNLIEESDRAYVTNGLLSVFGKNDFHAPEYDKSSIPSLEEILSSLLRFAENEKLIPEDSVVFRDLFDTKLMGVLTPRPSEVIKKFFELYKSSPRVSTDYFYNLCISSDYIREYRIKKDLKWTVDSEYGVIDITVNLSKPEKDPKAIAAAKNAKQTSYPPCNLCHENEGFEGSVSQPARQTLRQIPLTLANEEWFLQYSPYSYYNEHCIALSGKHTPMKIDRSTFRRALDFVELLPHYFIGSNADLPIVGGSILSHDHMQGGDYTFAMAKAPIEHSFTVTDYPNVKCGIVKWPMSVIRLSSESKDSLVELGDKILGLWRSYSDPNAYIFANTNGEDHNTITPIARKNGELFELDLVLRNNITTEEHPDGLFHPHAELHNIKKENIGLIEVMGLAVLPARLKNEMAELEKIILSGEMITESSPAAKHQKWFENFKSCYTFTAENTEEILRKEIGKTFVKVLEDAGVYKRTENGRTAFVKFINTIN